MIDVDVDGVPPVVSYLGPAASFSHQAAINAFEHVPATLVPAPSFAEVFDIVQLQGGDQPKNGPAYYGVVPIENSSNGSVVQLLDLLADHDDKYPDITVCGEYYLPVHHCLLVKRTQHRETEGGGVNNVSRDPERNKNALQDTVQLYTHPQVWGQCTRYLAKHLKGVERIDVGSTSLAAQKVKLDSGVSMAAIASRLAADYNDLEVLAENIEDEGSNTTRFLVLRNAKPGSRSMPRITNGNSAEHRQTKWKSLFSFAIDHESPGSLADALAVFKSYSFNLTSIYTRPSREHPWHYIFFVECAKIVSETDLQDQHRMIGELEKHTKRLRQLGRWEDMLEGG